MPQQFKTPNSKLQIVVALRIDHWEFHEVCLYESVNLAVHHSVHVRGLIVGAVVLYAAVVKDIGAYLAAPFNLLLACLNLRLRLETFLHGAGVEL